MISRSPRRSPRPWGLGGDTFGRCAALALSHRPCPLCCARRFGLSLRFFSWNFSGTRVPGLGETKGLCEALGGGGAAQGLGAQRSPPAGVREPGRACLPGAGGPRSAPGGLEDGVRRAPEPRGWVGGGPGVQKAAWDVCPLLCAPRGRGNFLSACLLSSSGLSFQPAVVGRGSASWESDPGSSWLVGPSLAF